MTDKQITCKACDEIFIFRQSEAEYYQLYKRPEPNYCPVCRKAFYRMKAQEKEAREKVEREEKRKRDYERYEKMLENWTVCSPECIDFEKDDDILYILGNGFDLMHGVKSSYWDFGQTIGKNSPLAFFLENYLDVDDLWSDFENALAKINVEGMCSPYVLDTHLDIMEVYDPDASAASFFAAAEMAAGPILAMNTELKQRFRKWVDSLTTNTDDRPLKPLFQNGKVLDFNYTEFVETLYGVEEADVCYIHGSRKKRKGRQREELILGHMPGDSDLQYEFEDKYEGLNLSGNRAQILYDAQQTALQFVVDADNGLTKYCDEMIRTHQSFFEELSGINKIVTVGHSLYPVDWEYFGEILRRNHAPEGIRWFFGCYNGADLERIEAFIRHYKIDKDHVSVFRSDLIHVTCKENHDLDNKHMKNVKNHAKSIGISDDGAWEVCVDKNRISIVDRHSSKTIFTRIFATYVNGAVFDKSGTVLLLVIRGLHEGVFLLRYDGKSWNYITELQGIPYQGLITKRLNRIVLQEEQLVFSYNSRIRKYSLSDGTLVYNEAKRGHKAVELSGEDLTQKFLKVYRNGFY